MKTLNRNAAHFLFEKVKTLKEYHNSWRCIYLNLSDSPEHPNYQRRNHFVIRTITGLLDKHEGYIFACNDGDIFILFQGAFKPIVDTLAEHFDGLRPEHLWNQPSDKLFTVFDLSRYWELFYDFCKVKARREADVLRQPNKVYAKGISRNELISASPRN